MFLMEISAIIVTYCRRVSLEVVKFRDFQISRCHLFSGGTEALRKLVKKSNNLSRPWLFSS